MSVIKRIIEAFSIPSPISKEGVKILQSETNAAEKIIKAVEQSSGYEPISVIIAGKNYIITIL